MAVTIITKEEKYSKVVEGATFYYRRIPGRKRAAIVRRFTDKRTGYTDWNEASQVMLEYCVLGWENVIQSNGEIFPFSSEDVQYIPDDIQSVLIELVGANIDKTAGEVKNSSSTLNSNLETTD